MQQQEAVAGGARVVAAIQSIDRVGRNGEQRRIAVQDFAIGVDTVQ